MSFEVKFEEFMGHQRRCPVLRLSGTGTKTFVDLPLVASTDRLSDRGDLRAEVTERIVGELDRRYWNDDNLQNDRDYLATLDELVADAKHQIDLAEAKINELQATKDRLQLERPPQRDAGQQIFEIDSQVAELKETVEAEKRNLSQFGTSRGEVARRLRTAYERPLSQIIQQEIKNLREQHEKQIERINAVVGPEVGKLEKLENAIGLVRESHFTDGLVLHLPSSPTEEQDSVSTDTAADEPTDKPTGTTASDDTSTGVDTPQQQSQEDPRQRIEQRRQRVRAARMEGKSIRTIAESEGVDSKTIQTDLKSLNLDSTPESIVGQDGKTYPATVQQ